MKIIDVNGNMTMYDIKGLPKIVANIKYGTTYGSQDNKDMRTAMLTVFAGHNSLQDSFVFYSKGNIPFTFIQSRNLNPYLKSIYVNFLVDESDKTIGNLLTKVIADYFVDKLEYSHPNYDQFLKQLMGEINA